MIDQPAEPSPALEPPITCVGIPTEPACAEPAIGLIILHGSCAGICCERHTRLRVQEVMDQGHGACRFYGITSGQYPIEDIRKLADRIRGKLTPLPRGRYYKLKKKR